MFGDGDGAQPHAGEIENGIGRHVGQPQRHPVARPDAEIGQALGGARRTVEQFGKAQRPPPWRKAGAAGISSAMSASSVQTSAAGWISGMRRETTASLFHLKASLDALTRHGACSTKALPPPSDGGGGPQGRRGRAAVAMFADFRSEIVEDLCVAFPPPPPSGAPPPYDGGGRKLEI